MHFVPVTAARVSKHESVDNIYVSQTVKISIRSNLIGSRQRPKLPAILLLLPRDSHVPSPPTVLIYSPISNSGLTFIVNANCRVTTSSRPLQAPITVPLENVLVLSSDWQLTGDATLLQAEQSVHPQLHILDSASNVVKPSTLMNPTEFVLQFRVCVTPP